MNDGPGGRNRVACPTGWRLVNGVVFARKKLSEEEKNHESVHTLQWWHFMTQPAGSVSFIIEYAAAGGNACANYFEIQAGLADGAYAC